MQLPERLQRFAEPTPVLSDGSVRLIGVFGDDTTVVNAARISFGKDASEFSDTANRHLLRYLMRACHTTPFEMCELMLCIRMPMDAHRQQIRHRTASVNEYSTRYKPAIDSCDKTAPDAWRLQSTNNKQGSSGFLTEWPEGFKDQVEWEGFDPNKVECTPGEYLSHRETELQNSAREVYEERLRMGVAREQARKDLPLSTYTEYIWKMDLHNLLHYLSLRLDPHAQKEIREYAQAIAEIVKVWVPWTWEAFEDYRLRGMSLTRFEIAGLRRILQYAVRQVTTQSGADAQTVRGDWLQKALLRSGLPLPKEGKKEAREVTEFRAKFAKLLED